MNIFSDRVNLALSESFSTFNICRVVLENFDLEIDCGTVQIRFGHKIGRNTVQASKLPVILDSNLH